MLPNGRTGTQFSMRGALAATVSGLFILSSFAVADPGETKIEAVLSNLPAPGSPAYSTLYAAADRPHRELLDMTKAEVWTIAPERLEAVTAAATKVGAKLTKLDATWNHPFAPMATSAEMTAEQKAMMHETMESKAAVGMSMMALPPPSIAEYALTKGMHDAGPNAAAAETCHSGSRGQDDYRAPDKHCAGGGGLCLARRRRGDQRARHAAVVAFRKDEWLHHLSQPHLFGAQHGRRRARHRRNETRRTSGGARADGPRHDEEDEPQGRSARQARRCQHVDGRPQKSTPLPRRRPPSTRIVRTRAISRMLHPASSRWQCRVITRSRTRRYRQMRRSSLQRSD